MVTDRQTDTHTHTQTHKPTPVKHTPSLSRGELSRCRCSRTHSHSFHSYNVDTRCARSWWRVQRCMKWCFKRTIIIIAFQPAPELKPGQRSEVSYSTGSDSVEQRSLCRMNPGCGWRCCVIYYPRESEGVCFHRRWFVFVCLSVCDRDN